tara:strand:+ start:106 stop:270 length:165 start_codon:yes stop_codon:yes gene_type:complete
MGIKELQSQWWITDGEKLEKEHRRLITENKRLSFENLTLRNEVRRLKLFISKDF